MISPPKSEPKPGPVIFTVRMMDDRIETHEGDAVANKDGEYTITLDGEIVTTIPAHKVKRVQQKRKR